MHGDGHRSVGGTQRFEELLRRLKALVRIFSERAGDKPLESRLDRAILRQRKRRPEQYRRQDALDRVTRERSAAREAADRLCSDLGSKRQGVPVRHGLLAVPVAVCAVP
ncbi:MAG: hypothetical protein QF681_17110, partial [Vicinamibacterales bacterium]|nr:hypothetical protein [Vicinamibacterales bacterium]